MSVATYSLGLGNFSNETVNYGTTGTFARVITALFDPQWGLSAVRVDWFDEDGITQLQVSADRVFPTTLTDAEIVWGGYSHSEPINYNLLLNNDYLHANNIEYTSPRILVTAYCDTDFLSGGTVDTIDPSITGTIYFNTADLAIITALGGGYAEYELHYSNQWLAASVAYAASATLSQLFSATFTPVSSISAVTVNNIAIAGSNYSSRFAAVSTNAGAFPITLANVGWTGASPVYTFKFIFNNNVLHPDTQLVSAYTAFQSVIAYLSADALETIADGYSGTNTLTDITGGIYLTALGDPAAPSGGLVNFTAIPISNGAVLLWGLPLDVVDLSGARIQRSTTGIPSAYNDGTTVYMACGSTFTDTGLDDQTWYYYAGYAFDTVGKYSTDVVAASCNPTWARWSSAREHRRLYNLGLL